jgi:hypothetical protein
MGRILPHRPFLLALHKNRGVAMGLLSALILAIGWLNWMQLLVPRFTWFCTAVLLLLAIMVMGGAVNGRFEGVLIDSRNRISLSKFQMLLWTVVVLSALTVVAAWNITHSYIPVGEGKSGPLDIDIPTDLLYAMGIAAASFIGAPSLLQLKVNQDTSGKTMDAAEKRLGLTSDQATATGRVHKLCSPLLASWTDMFLGDDIGNAGSADLSKVQQFSITMLIVGLYIGSMWSVLGALVGKPGPISTLPPLSEGFVMLMAISHASYLAYKIVPHERTADGDDGGDKPDPRLDPVG